MQPLPDEASADGREWNPNDDDDFGGDNNFQGNVFEERASNPIFENNSMSQPRPGQNMVTQMEDENKSLVPKNLFGAGQTG